MQAEKDEVKKIFSEYNSQPITAIEMLPQAGSERHYFHIHTNDKTYIATHGANVKENESFIYFSQHFHKKHLCTPQIFYISADKKIYPQVPSRRPNACWAYALLARHRTAHRLQVFQSALS